MRAAVRGPKVPRNTIKPCVDIVHFLITMEFWNRTPTNRGTWCAANRSEPTHLDKEPEERWFYKCQALQTGPHPKPQKRLPPRFPDHSHFSHLGIQLYRWGHLQTVETNNEYLSGRRKAPTQRKALSAGICSVQMTAYPISSFPSAGRQRDRATISNIKMLGDLTFKIKSGIEKNIPSPIHFLL